MKHAAEILAKISTQQSAAEVNQSQVVEYLKECSTRLDALPDYIFLKYEKECIINLCKKLKNDLFSLRGDNLEHAVKNGKFNIENSFKMVDVLIARYKEHAPPLHAKMHCEKHNVEYDATLRGINSKGQGYYSPMLCPLCDKEVQEKKELEKQQKIAEDLAERDRKLRACGISDLYMQSRGTELSDKIGVIGKMQRYLEINDSDLIIYGPCGVGKTFFAYKFIELYVDAGLYPKIINQMELYSLTGGNFFKYDALVNFVEGYDFIILDEATLAYPWALNLLAEFVNVCYERQVRMMFITNELSDLFFNGLKAKTQSRLYKAELIDIQSLKDLRMQKRFERKSQKVQK